MIHTGLLTGSTEESLVGGFSVAQGSCRGRSKMKKHGYLLGPQCEQEVSPGGALGSWRGSPGVPGVVDGAWTGPHSVSLPVGGTRVCVPNHGPKFTQRDPVGPQHAEGSREPPLLVLGASRGRHREAGSGPAGLNRDARDVPAGAGDSIRACPATPGHNCSRGCCPAVQAEQEHDDQCSH